MILRKSLALALVLFAPIACKPAKSASTGPKNSSKLPASGNGTPAIETEIELPPSSFLSSWAQCFAMNGSTTVKAACATIYLMKNGEMKYLEKTFPDSECKGSYTDAQLSTLYKASNPTSKPSKAETALFNKAMRNGTVSTGAYKAPASEGAVASLDLTDAAGVTKYLSYKISGSTLTTSSACSEEDVGKIMDCKAVTGDSEKNRSKDFSSPSVYTKVGATGGKGTVTPIVPEGVTGTIGSLVASSYNSCLESGDPVVKGFFEEFTFVDAKTVSILNKIKGDANCLADLNKDQMLAFYKQSYPDQASASSVPDFFSSVVLQGTVQKAVYAATSATAGTIDILDEETLLNSYVSYKIENGKLHVTSPCEKEDIGLIPSCKAITGESAANRATDFANSMIFNKK